MIISKDLLEKAKQEKTVSEKQTDQAFDNLNTNAELSNDELEQTFGGTMETAIEIDELFPDNGEANYKYEVGQVVDAFYQGVAIRKAKIVRRYTVRLGIMWNLPMYFVEYSGGCAEIEENSIICAV